MTAQYTLYLGSKNFSSWSLRPWLAMKMAGLAFDEEVIPLYTPETKARISALSPTGKVPALRIAENGQTYAVWDSLAICETIAERHPEAQLWPGDPRPRAEARSIVAEMHSGFPDLRKALSMDIAKRYPTPEMDDALRAQVARVIAIWEGALKAHHGGFLFGRFSIADCFYAPVVTRFETYAVALPAVAQAYTQRILALAAMREWTASARAENEKRDYAARQV
jgi:glutathione S-transferase